MEDKKPESSVQRLPVPPVEYTMESLIRAAKANPYDDARRKMIKKNKRKKKPANDKS